MGDHHDVEPTGDGAEQGFGVAPVPAAHGHAGLMHQQEESHGGHESPEPVGDLQAIPHQKAHHGREDDVEPRDEPGLRGRGEPETVRLQPEDRRQHEAQVAAVQQVALADGNPEGQEQDSQQEGPQREPQAQHGADAEPRLEGHLHGREAAPPHDRHGDEADHGPEVSGARRVGHV